MFWVLFMVFHLFFFLSFYLAQLLGLFFTISISNSASWSEPFLRSVSSLYVCFFKKPPPLTPKKRLAFRMGAGLVAWPASCNQVGWSSDVHFPHMYLSTVTRLGLHPCWGLSDWCCLQGCFHVDQLVLYIVWTPPLFLDSATANIYNPWISCRSLSSEEEPGVEAVIQPDTRTS